MTSWRSCWRYRGLGSQITFKSTTEEEPYMQKITPFLWLNDRAEEAMNFYVSVFKNSRVVSVTRFTEPRPRPNRAGMSATFQLDGQDFFALNRGPTFTSTP